VYHKNAGIPLLRDVITE